MCRTQSLSRRGWALRGFGPFEGGSLKGQQLLLEEGCDSKVGIGFLHAEFLDMPGLKILEK